MERGGQHYYYHADGLGSITDLTNSAGTVVQNYVYDSFGNIVLQNGSLTNPYTYTGREFDPESGLYYYRARYYDAGIGRFLQEDPIGLLGGLNLHFYVDNNPVLFVDPSGEIPLPLITGIIGGVAGGTGNAIGQIISNGGLDNFSWRNVGIASGTGFVAGAAAPFAATSLIGATSLGVSANVAQYAITQFANNQGITPSGVTLSAITGAVGGAIAGPVSKGTGLLFDADSKFLVQRLAKSLNNDAAILANTRTSNLLRSAGAGIASNISK